MQAMHAKTKRDYVARVFEHDKAECAEIAKRFGQEYWDGERRFGYGGYRYDGRWRPVAQYLAATYGLRAGERVLDIGCGKGFLLYDLTQAVSGIKIAGVDISAYAVDHAQPEVRAGVQVADAAVLPYPARSFDFIVSLGTLHNLAIADLFRALAEIERVGKSDRKYIMVESFRNEREKANLLYWQLTCASFYSTSDWEWIFKRCGYTGDYGFIFFE